ncbi:MAG TPA: hypothetical protein VGB77_11120 [Abditibacteriaceae bacterium]|jgi:hypothetical protein
MQNNAEAVREQLEGISFPDAEIVSAFLEAQEAHVVIKDWRERRINLRFGGVVLFKSFGFGGGIFSHLMLTESKEIDEAIEVIKQDYGSVPEEHGLVHLSFADDAPLLVVVFSSLQIEIES